MLNRKRDNKSSEIITWFYGQTFDQDTENRINDKFALWLASKEYADGKMEVLDRLIRKEFFSEKSDALMSEGEKAAYEALVKRFTGADGGRGNGQGAQSVGRKRTIGRTAASVAAVIALAIVVGGGIYALSHDGMKYAYQVFVKNGSLERLTLRDSTAVIINSGSQFDVDQNRHKRVANLAGEAFFDVTNDGRRPFIVKTKELEVTVLGTSFNIEAYSESNFTVITLVEGKISLTTNNGEQWELNPNELFLYDKTTQRGEIQKLDEHETTDMIAWVDGYSVYNYRTLEDIFKFVERRFNVEIEIDPRVALSSDEYMIHINPDDTPEKVMNALRILTDKFDFTMEQDKIYVTAPKEIEEE